MKSLDCIILQLFAYSGHSVSPKFLSDYKCSECLVSLASSMNCSIYKNPANFTLTSNVTVPFSYSCTNTNY